MREEEFRLACSAFASSGALDEISVRVRRDLFDTFSAVSIDEWPAMKARVESVDELITIVKNYAKPADDIYTS